MSKAKKIVKLPIAYAKSLVPPTSRNGVLMKIIGM